ncbi:MAG: hypothetical protein A2Y94_11555 [Caldithrix sp. RBG_13_44_9]|nr:MAG: hypothetical protein A2Y94_11555 [Caldithrix sp. RBG_13_44_9]
MKEESSGLGQKLKNLSHNLPRLKELALQDPYEVYSNLPMEVAIYDLQGNYNFVNNRYIVDEKISRSLIGKSDEEFARLLGISTDSLQKRKQNFQRTLQENKVIQFTEKLYFPGKNQTLYYKRIFQPLYSSRNNQEIVAVCLYGNSLTSIIQAQKELKYLVYHDKLTGFANRDAFFERLDQMIVESDRDQGMNAILLCDIDNFKIVNEAVGQKVADFCLKEVANRILSSIRKSDLIFRIGGDDFAVILRNLNHEYDASRVAEKIIKDVSSPYSIMENTINYLTMSIGIVLFPRDGQDRDVLIQRVSFALKNAKKTNRNDFQFFSEDLTEKSVKRLEMEKNLRSVVQDNGYDKQFEILYQPIVEKKSDRQYTIIGCEALLRWHNSDLGTVSPDIFIPIAEESDLICQLGDWVLYKAIKDFKAMTERVKKPLHLSLNLSAKQMKSPDIVHKIEKIIKNTQVQPSDLHLELTETSLLDEGLQVIRNLEDIEKLGLKIAIDDFGVGFASLKYLQKFPVSIIKIDRSFIKHINLSNEHKKLVESIILLGKNLNKDIIAEGVESLEHLYVLYTQKCYKYQGYLFSKPVTLQELENLVSGEYHFQTLMSSMANSSRFQPEHHH